MGEKARLRRDLIVAQQQRDQAQAERDRAVTRAVRLEAELAEVRDRSPWSRVSGWWADLARTVGL